MSSGVTISTIVNNGNEVTPSGGVYDLTTGSIVASGTRDVNYPIRAEILYGLATTAGQVRYDSGDASKYTATWPDYVLTGDDQTLRVEQTVEPFDFAEVTIDVS
jgi:hypothetical protein